MGFIVKEHQPGKAIVIRGVILVLWIGSLLATYYFSTQHIASAYFDEQTHNQLLTKALQQANNRDKQERAKIAVLEKTAQVDRQAKIDLSAEISHLQQYIARLQEDVSFYKSVMSLKKGQTGPSIYSFTASAANDEGNLYHFKVVLTQSGKNKKPIEGQLDISVRGILSNQETTLNLSDIKVMKDGTLPYKFRYYQEISGSLRFPAGFSPRDVVVRLEHKANNKTIRYPASRFDWSKVKV